MRVLCYVRFDVLVLENKAYGKKVLRRYVVGVRGCRCVFLMITVLLLDRGGAGAGGAAALALQRLPAGAQRVPAAQTATAQVPLQHHVTSRRRRAEDEDRRTRMSKDKESQT